MAEYSRASRSASWMSATVRELPTYLLFDDNDLDPRCEIENCVTTIESILDENGPAASALTSEQAAEIRALRRKVRAATQQPSHALWHGADFRRKFIPSEVMVDLNATKDRTGHVVKSFIASHFGGVVLPSVGSRKKGSVAVAARVESSTQYVPPEWERLSLESRTTLTEMLSWESLSKWGLDMLEVARLSLETKDGEDCQMKKKVCPLLLVGWAIFASPYSQREMHASIGGTLSEAGTCGGIGYDFANKFNIQAKTLCSFLRTIESGYKQDVPYHNSTHAADVLQTTHALLQYAGDNLSNLFTPLDRFSTLFAAAVHDCGHPGTNNSFQINARTDIAIRYNDRSVLENMHASKAFQLLMGSLRKPELDVLKGLSLEEANTARRNIIDAVLSTDMQEHFTAVANMKETLPSFDMTPTDDDNADIGSERREKVNEVLRFVLHLADISNSAKPAPLCHQWADRVLEEFFSQGDREKELGLPVSPLCDRETTDKAESQIGFIKFVVQPAFEVLAQVIPRVSDEILPVLKDNLRYWELQKEQSVVTSIGEEA